MILESIYARLGEPFWYWPSVIAVIFVGLPCMASALESAL